MEKQNVKMYIFTEENLVPAQADIGPFCNKVFVSLSVLNHTWMASNNGSIIFHLGFVYQQYDEQPHVHYWLGLVPVPEIYQSLK